MDILIKNIELKGTLLLTPKAIFKPVEKYDHEKIVQKWEIVKEAEIVELPPHGRLKDEQDILRIFDKYLPKVDDDTNSLLCEILAEIHLQTTTVLEAIE